ncbi:hypothetical protein ACQ86N_06425 [Puia sp. P3]|uniref:hypothetical protein n=1 Tax=Puia sp. P3 TaxID=3423952 RepID=UPI003D66CFB3
MKDKVGGFLEHFAESRPEVKEIVRPYLEAIDEEKGVAFSNRRDLEVSIQLVNKTINRHLEVAADELQKSYPSYFEKFRTDGIESRYLYRAVYCARASVRPFVSA